MRLGTIAVVAALALLAAACDGSESTVDATQGDEAAQGGEAAEEPTELQAVREATAQFSDPAVATDAGYRPTEECVAHPEADSAMGMHYVDPELMQEAGTTPTEPEVLVYVPAGDGIELGAVEWVVPDADQDLATDEDRPSLFGQDFDGPMEGHEEGQPIHYDLHAWLYVDNPDGTFAMWNSDVTCPPQGEG